MRVFSRNLLTAFIFAQLLALFSALAAPPNYEPTFSATATSLEHAFDSLLNSDEKLSNYGVTSIVLSVVHNNAILFSKGYGFADPFEKKLASAQSSLYNIASVTKTFTVTVAMQLYEQGKFNVSQPIQNFLAANSPLVKNDIIGFDDNSGDSYMNFPKRPTHTDITVRQLMTHTAGYDERMFLSMPTAQDRTSVKDYLESRMPPRIRETDTCIAYSNMGIALLSHLVENTAQDSCGNLIRNKIFEPLNMNNSYFDFSAALESNPNYAKPAVRVPGGNSQSYIEMKQYGQYISVPAIGGIWSTAEDVSRYAMAHLNYGLSPETGNRILHEDTARYMYAQHFSNHKELPGIGLIWFQNKFETSEGISIDYISHGGVLPPYFSTLALFHKYNCAIFITTTARDATVLKPVLQKFVYTALLNHTATCSGKNMHFNEATSECTETVAIENIKPVDDTRWSLYTGCYKNQRYDHTSWLKYAMSMFYMTPICFAKSGNLIKQTFPLGSSNVLVEVSKNVFEMGVMSGNDQVSLSRTSRKLVSFLFPPNAHQPQQEQQEQHAVYMVINQESFEIANWSFFASIAFWISAALLQITVTITLCACCCVGGADVYNTYKVFCGQDDANMSTYDSISNEFETYLPNEDDDLLLGPEAAAKRRRKRRISQSEGNCFSFNMARNLTITCSVFTSLAFILVSLFNFMHIIGITARVIYINSASTYFVTQSAAPTVAILTLPFASAATIAVLLICGCVTVALRIYLREYMLKVHTICIALCMLPVILVNLLYFAAAGYYNIFGFMFFNK